MESLYEKLINFAIKIILVLFKKRTYVIYTDGKKYLQRTYIKKKGWLPEIFLHRFYASDSDRHLHNHPWRWAKSLILSGSYKEERYYWDIMPDSTWAPAIVWSPGKINSIKATDYHRVTLLSETVTTLFVAGKRTQSWGFWVDGKHVPWQEYVVQHNNFVTDLEGNITVLPE